MPPSDHSPLPPEDLVRRSFPPEGPFDGSHTGAAAVALYELVGYLNDAASRDIALPDPGAVYDLLECLAEATERQQQLLRQVSRRLRAFAQDERLIGLGTASNGDPHGVGVYRLDDANASLVAARAMADRLLQMLREASATVRRVKVVVDYDAQPER
jgi:hypothetical protein